MDGCGHIRHGVMSLSVICETDPRDQSSSKIKNHETLAIALTQLKSVELFEFRVGSAMLAAGPLTHEFNRPARMGRDQRIDKVAPHGLQTGGRPGLVNTHEARVAFHIG